MCNVKDEKDKGKRMVDAKKQMRERERERERLKRERD